MKKVKQLFVDSWVWVKEKAVYSWTMWGALILSLAEVADSTLQLLPPEVQGTPKVIFVTVILGLLRARTV